MQIQKTEEAQLSDFKLKGTLQGGIVLEKESKTDSLSEKEEAPPANEEVEIEESPDPPSPYVPSPEIQSISSQEYQPSSLLAKGQSEWRWFANSYIDNAFFNQNAEKQSLGYYRHFHTSSIYALFGSQSSWNFGLEAAIKFVNDQNSSLEQNKRLALSGLGPKIKWKAPSFLAGITWQSTFLFPIAQNQDGTDNQSAYLSFDGYNFWNQLFFDNPLGRSWNLFLGADLIYNISRQHEPNNSSVSASFKCIPSWFLNPKNTLYTMVEYAPSFGEEGIVAYYGQGGLGFKRQLSSIVEAELLYTSFLLGKNAGAGQTFNLGLRFLIPR